MGSVSIMTSVNSDETVRQQWHPTVVFPRVPGHEIVGDVVSVAPGEKLWKVGDRVGAGWHGGHCHACHSCRAGDFVQCVNASPHVNGERTDTRSSDAMFSDRSSLTLLRRRTKRRVR